MTIAASPGSRKGVGGLGEARARFRNWRQTRPFWGAVISIIGGVEIYLAAAAPLAVVVMQGLPGLLTMAVFLVTVILAGVTLFQPHLRSITGLLILIIGPLSIMATNLGGFVVGMILLVVGGGLILAWAPAEDPLDLEYISGDSAREPSPRTRTASVAAAPAAATTEYPAYQDDHEATPASLDPDRPDHFSSARTSSYEPVDSVDPIPSSSLSGTPARSSSPGMASPEDELAAQKAALKASQTRPGQKKKRPAPAPRTGLAGVFDTMFGTRPKSPKSSSGRKPGSSQGPGQKPGQKSAPKPGQKRTPPPGKRPAGKRPANGRPATKRAPGTKPASGSSDSSATAPLSSLDRPGDSTTANARTWIVIPMLLLALATPAVLAAPASANPVRPSSDGPLDWLFPPATPTPAPTVAPTPTPSPTGGLVLPSLPDLLNPTPAPAPTPTPGDGTADPADGVANAADCAAADGLKGTTSGGQAAVDGAAAMAACAKAAEADPPSAKAVATDLKVSNDLIDLKASRMEMEGFGYAGLATLQSDNGPVETLHFTADSVKIYDMDQSYPFVGGTNILKNAEGNAELKGNVNLYVKTFDSKIFGLIPLEFTTDFQPPLVLPSMFFTDAKSVVVLVQSDQILLPDLNISIGK